MAENVLTRLLESGALTRGEIAGSVRRRRDEVHDLEIVGVPKMRKMMGMLTDEVEPDLPYIREVLRSEGWTRGPPNKAGAKAPFGPRYLKLDNGDGLQLDLFLVYPPCEWGVLFFIRTGSAKWSMKVVTRLHDYGLKSEDGHIVRVATGETLPCPEEEMMFTYAHLPYVEPKLRDMDLPETAKLFEEP